MIRYQSRSPGERSNQVNRVEGKFSGSEKEDI